MTDTQSGPREPEPATDDRQARFLKSLIKVLTDNRDVLSSLPEMMEQCLGKEAKNPSLTETENVEDNRNDDLERLAVRKREDTKKQLESLQGDIDMKTQRVAALDQTIKEKTATIEAMESKQSTLMSTKDRNLMGREFKKRDKQLHVTEASEKQVKSLEKENMKLKNELEKKEKEKSETVKLQEEKKSTEKELKNKDKQLEASDKQVKLLVEENLKFKSELEKKEKEKSDTVKLQEEKKSTEKELKNKDKQLEASDKQVKLLEEENLKFKSELEKKEKEKSETVKLQEEKMATVTKESEKRFKDMSDTAQVIKEKNDSLIKELEVKDEETKAYTQSFSKMKDDLSNAYMKMEEYKSRLASLSEKRVKQDQRLVEDTLGSNRQSELERDFSAFFDEDRVDACEKMQSIYQDKEETFIYIYYPRLACIIFETAYEQVKEAKEAASDLFKELIKKMIDLAPHMGQYFSNTRKENRKGQGDQTCTIPIVVNIWGDGAEHSKDIMDGMMLSLKEIAHTCNLDRFVNSVSKIVFEKWTKWLAEDKSCMFTPSTYFLTEDLVKYIKACIRLTWRMVTQVPPMKLEFHCSKFNKDIHKKMGYHSSLKVRSKSNRPSDQNQDEEIACYLWPGLQDGGGRRIRAGEVICKVKEQ